MAKIDDIRRILEEHRGELKDIFGVRELGIFGSYLRSEQTDDSDLDILVEFYQPPGLFEFVRLKNYLSDLIGVPVDLVMKSALKPRIGQRILSQVTYV